MASDDGKKLNEKMPKEANSEASHSTGYQSIKSSFTVNNEEKSANSGRSTCSNIGGDKPISTKEQTDKTVPASLNKGNPEQAANAISQQDQSISASSENASVRSKKLATNHCFIFLNFLFSAVIILIIVAVLGLFIAKGIFNGAGPSQESAIVWIKPGTGIKGIAAILADKKLIKSERFFVYGVTIENKSKDLKAGEYLIPAHASMKQIIDILISGKPIQHSFTVPEGLTVQQVFDRLELEKFLSGDLPKALPPEGSLMANTVSYSRGTTRLDIIKRLQAEQAKLVAEVWAGRAPDLPLKNPSELVTLASIVEKETGIATERPRIAAVFYNRLAKNMRLQSDPTVIYGLFGGAGKPADRPIYRSDLEKETPFNTYKIYGLPPSPIANPGKDSLEATAHPAKTDDLFFVADGTGGHIFAKSLNEHNANVRRWRNLHNNRQPTNY